MTKPVTPEINHTVRGEALTQRRACGRFSWEEYRRLEDHSHHNYSRSSRRKTPKKSRDGAPPAQMSWDRYHVRIGTNKMPWCGSARAYLKTWRPAEADEGTSRWVESTWKWGELGTPNCLETWILLVLLFAATWQPCDELATCDNWHIAIYSQCGDSQCKKMKPKCQPHDGYIVSEP